MLYDPELEEGENLIFQAAFVGYGGTQASAAYYHFALSDRALYWLAAQAVDSDDDTSSDADGGDSKQADKEPASRDAPSFSRIPRSEISEVRARRLPDYRAYGALVVFILVIGIGVWHHEFDYLLLMAIVLAPLTFFAFKNRLCLEIETRTKTVRWKPPVGFMVWFRDRQAALRGLDGILTACEKAGLATSRNYRYNPPPDQMPSGSTGISRFIISRGSLDSAPVAFWVIVIGPLLLFLLWIFIDVLRNNGR